MERSPCDSRAGSRSCSVIRLERALPIFGGLTANLGGKVELDELDADFEAAQRRPLKTRLRSAFIKTCKPVLDERTARTFNTMREYRQWCNETLPEWLGYQSVH